MCSSGCDASLCDAGLGYTCHSPGVIRVHEAGYVWAPASQLGYRQTPRAPVESAQRDCLLLHASVGYVTGRACRDVESACGGGHDGQPAAG
jgi:hypothetical protein